MRAGHLACQFGHAGPPASLSSVVDLRPMNERNEIYNNFPWSTPFLENMVWLGVYLLGSAIFAIISLWVSAAYFVYCLVSMYLLIPRFVCTHCSYYGMTCHSGQGRLAALLFSKRDTELFSSCFKNMRFAAPVFLAPLVTGLILSFLHFSWGCVASTIGFGILALGCTRMVTKRLGCPHCGQKPICPACRNFKT